MPYDYYDYFKKENSNENYLETTEIVRQKIWNETINFKKSQEWMNMEDKLLIKLYRRLKYS